MEDTIKISIPADNMDEIKHNFKQVDSLPYAKEGTLKVKLDELYGD